jgi:hypothetical protein
MPTPISALATLAALATPLPKRPKLKYRDQMQQHLINCLVIRTMLARPPSIWTPLAQHEENFKRLRTELAEHDLAIERLLIPRLDLDHLTDVDTVYGLKLRQM